MIEQYLRQLARNSYWQSIYSSSKDLSNISIFFNKINYSGIQISFLNWLRIYDMLYSELSQKEDSRLTEEVIKDDHRCDAYLHYRRKKIEGEWKKHREEERLSKLRNLHPKKRAKDAQLIDVDLRSV